MAQENELQTLREELKALHDQTRRSRRRAAVGFVILLLVVIVSFVYAFVQSIEAERSRELASNLRELAERAQVEAGNSLLESKRQEAIAKENRAAAERAASELAACCRKK